MADPRILQYISQVHEGTEWKHNENGSYYVVDSFCELGDSCGCYLKSPTAMNIAVSERNFFDVFEEVV
jgi:hypothetical protein